MTFDDLRTGDVVNLMGVRSVVLAIEKPHPLNPSFLLIIWWIFDQKRLSMDMLHPDYALMGNLERPDDMRSWTQAMNEACR
jgi:hypothetical protein